MPKEDDGEVRARTDDIGGYEVPAAGGDPDSRMRLLKHARAAAETTDEDLGDYDDAITDERNRAGRGPQQDEEAAEELERAREEREAAAEKRRASAESSTSETSPTSAPQGRSATPPARSTTATGAKSATTADKGK